MHNALTAVHPPLCSWAIDVTVSAHVPIVPDGASGIAEWATDHNAYSGFHFDRPFPTE